MTIKELIKELGKFNPDSRVLIGSDEELNIMFEGFEVAELTGTSKTLKDESGNEYRDENGQCVVLPLDVVIYGLSGDEYDQEEL